MTDQSIPNKRDNRIDYLKAFAVIMVIVHHCLSYCDTTYHEVSQFERLGIVLLHTSHVPIFCIVAGYLCHRQPIASFYKKKIRRILVPFVAFSLLKILYAVFVSAEFRHGGSTILEQLKFSFLVGTQYWFAYAIMGLFLLAPLFWTRGGGTLPRSLIALIVSYLVVLVITVMGTNPVPNYFQMQEIIYYLPYFAFGCLLNQVSKETIMRFRQHERLIIYISIIAIVSFSVIYLVFPNIRIHPIRFFIALAIAYLLYSLIAKMGTTYNNTLLLLISKYSLQIMFLDGLYRVVIFALLGRIVGINLLISMIISIPTIGLSIITCVIAEKIPPIRFLFGL